MDFYLLSLRIIHIFGGVFWAGSAFLLVGFLSPAVAQAGPAGPKVMQRLILGTRFTIVTTLAAILAVLSGLLLYWRASNGLQGAWISTGTGIIFTLGGLAGLVALFTGATLGQTSGKLARLGAGIEGAPTPEQAAEIQALQARLQTLGTVTSVLLVVTLIGMATAQYVFF